MSGKILSAIFVLVTGIIVVTICEGHLSIGKRGLDIIIAVDTSSSIGIDSLNIAKKFMKILVKQFGVSKDPKGGERGTRFAIVTFASSATVHLQIDDKTVRTIEATNAKIDEITTTGGGTSILNALYTIVAQIHIRKILREHRRGQDTNKAVFLITDAEQTVRDNDQVDRLDPVIGLLKDAGYEIFTMGVGRNINRLMLKKIASEPTEEHVFLIDKFKDLNAIGDTIAMKYFDYGKCGISGNTEINRGTDHSNKGAWPWVGWFSANSETCGGVLLCARYFMTSASCVSEVNVTGQVIPYISNEITVNLGDSKLFEADDEQVMPVVNDVIIHPYYTGVPNDHGIQDYDVAILDFGKDKSTQPPLNKFIKPICFPYRKMYYLSRLRLEYLKGLYGEEHGFTAGWGHSPGDFTRQIPWDRQKQNRRDIHSDNVCGRRYPHLDTDRYFCVGNLRKEGDSCRGDIGGAYMAELETLRFSALGLAQKTYDCEENLAFSIFLDLHHPSITEWARPILGRCNRLGSAEDEEKEAKLERELARKKAADEALAKKRIEEAELAKKRAEEEALAKKRAEEEALAKRRIEEADLAKKRAEEAELAKKRAEEEALDDDKADEAEPGGDNIQAEENMAAEDDQNDANDGAGGEVGGEK